MEHVEAGVPEYLLGMTHMEVYAVGWRHGKASGKRLVRT